MNYGHMELRHLLSFLAVVREGNFTRAAARMHIAQPPLSRRIRELEESLGVQLFQRSTRHVSLTPAGESFKQRITEILMQLDRAVHECRLTHQGITGTLRIGYTGRSSYALLPQLIRQLRAHHPLITLDLVGPEASLPLSLELLRGNLDVALCFLPLKDDSISTRTLRAIDFVVGLPSTHPLTSYENVPIEKLRDEPFVAYPAGMTLRAAADRECERSGFTPRVIQEAATSQVLLCLVAAGTGVAIIPDELQSLETIDGVVFRSISPQPQPLEHGLAWLNTNPNPALQNLLKLDFMN